nr:UDP-glucosyltransferase 29-like [Setaria viridis]
MPEPDDCIEAQSMDTETLHDNSIVPMEIHACRVAGWFKVWTLEEISELDGANLQAASAIYELQSMNYYQFIISLSQEAHNPINLAAIAHRKTDRIRLVELHLPPLPDLPPALHTAKHLPPRLMPTLKSACDLAARRPGPRRSRPRRGGARRPRSAPRHLQRRRHGLLRPLRLGSADYASRAFPFESVGLDTADEEAEYTELFAMREDVPALVSERDRLLLSLARSSRFVAVKTCADIERKYMDYLSELLGGKEIIP